MAHEVKDLFPRSLSGDRRAIDDIACSFAFSSELAVDFHLHTLNVQPALPCLAIDVITITGSQGKEE
jgi:hypothetical protein